MKSRKTILTLVMCVTLIGCYAQKMNDNMVIPIGSINVVVITNLSGDCTIFQSKTNEIKAKSGLYTKGDSWGWRFPKERPTFKISSKKSNDTLYIEMPSEFNFKIIGISTYSEQIRSVLQIPDDKEVIIQKANKLTIEDEFYYLNIQNTSDLSCNNIKKVKTKSIMCNAHNMLFINGIKSNNMFEFHGAGTGNYILNANKISLTIK